MKGTLPRTALALAVITACLAGSALAQQPHPVLERVRAQLLRWRRERRPDRPGHHGALMPWSCSDRWRAPDSGLVRRAVFAAATATRLHRTHAETRSSGPVRPRT